MLKMKYKGSEVTIGNYIVQRHMDVTGVIGCWDLLAETIDDLVNDETKNLRKALQPFVDFLEAFERRPIRGLDPEFIYTIHGGEDSASLRWPDLKNARKALNGEKI